MLGLPVQGQEAFAAGRAALAESVLHMNANGGGTAATVYCALWDRRLAAAEVREKCESDLWEAVRRGFDVTDTSSAHPPQLDAAVALQDCLDKEMGGWPNTFG